jgi:hypothetical protein
MAVNDFSKQLFTLQKKKFFLGTLAFTAFGVVGYEMVLGMYSTWTGSAFQKETSEQGKVRQWQMTQKDLVTDTYVSSEGVRKMFYKRS